MCKLRKRSFIRFCHSYNKYCVSEIIFIFFPHRNGNPEIVEEVQISGRNLASVDASQNGEKESAAYYYQSASGGSANYPELALLASIQPIAGQQQQQQQGSSVQTPVQGMSSVVIKNLK